MHKQFTSAVTLTAVEGDLHCVGLSCSLSLQSMFRLLFTDHCKYVVIYSFVLKCYVVQLLQCVIHYNTE